MANTLTLIASQSFSSASAIFDFQSIPSTYTDLLMICSTRSSNNALDNAVRFNNDATSIYSWTQMQSGASTGNAGAARTANTSAMRAGGMQPSTYLANTYNSTSIYIASYAGNNFKNIIADGVDENNSGTNYAWYHAGTWRSTAAINRIQFLVEAGGNMDASSKISLYGIKNTA
jgi:hypothetical protein